MHVLVAPSHGRGPDDRTKRPAEGCLVCEAAFQGNLRKWCRGRPQQELRALHPAGDEVAVNRHSEGALERATEMANGEAALFSKVRKPKFTLQVAVDQFHQAALLPGRQTALIDGPRGSYLPIRSSDMAAEHPHEIVEHQAAYPPLVAQPWQCEPGQMKQYIILNSLRAWQAADPMHIRCRR